MSPGAKHKELMAARPAPRRHPAAEFPLTFQFRANSKVVYPRAAVRLQPDGKWLLQVWVAPEVVRNDPKPLTHDTRLAAFVAGQREVHALRTQRHPAGQLWLRGIAKDHARELVL